MRDQPRSPTRRAGTARVVGAGRAVGLNTRTRGQGVKAAIRPSQSGALRCPLRLLPLLAFNKGLQLEVEDVKEVLVLSLHLIGLMVPTHDRAIDIEAVEIGIADNSQTGDENVPGFLTDLARCHLQVHEVGDLVGATVGV